MKKYTYSAKDSDNQNKWWIVDAEDAVLGRLASSIAARLRGIELDKLDGVIEDYHSFLDQLIALSYYCIS